VVAHGDRLVAGHTRFHQAAIVAVARLLAVVVAEVDFHPTDMLAKPVEGGADDRLHMFVQPCMTFDGFIGVDIDLHMLTPGYTRRQGQSIALRGQRRCMTWPVCTRTWWPHRLAHGFILLHFGGRESHVGSWPYDMLRY
jgi:hypothetical protein